MNLSDTQVSEFHEQGYVFLPDVFSADEISALTRELEGIFAQDRPENVREKNGRAVRTTFAAHTFNEAFALLGRHPRLINPVMQLLGTIVYLSLCHVDNHIRRFKRPEWIAHRDLAAIEALPDDCLLARVRDPLTPA